VDLIAFASVTQVFLIVNWLMKHEGITKLFFGFPQDLVRLNLLFQSQGKSFAAGDHLASVVDLYSQRIQRLKVFASYVEDTPLGRDQALGEALRSSDFEELQRLSGLRPSHPPRDRLVEQVTTIQQRSLADMCARYLRIELDKSLQVSNWNFRPLSVAQVVYAATDAHVLLRLEGVLQDLGILPQRVWGCGPRSSSQAAWWREERAP